MTKANYFIHIKIQLLSHGEQEASITETNLMKFYAKITAVYCEYYREDNGLHFVEKYRVCEYSVWRYVWKLLQF